MDARRLFLCWSVVPFAFPFNGRALLKLLSTCIALEIHFTVSLARSAISFASLSLCIKFIDEIKRFRSIFVVLFLSFGLDLNHFEYSKSVCMCVCTVDSVHWLCNDAVDATKKLNSSPFKMVMALVNKPAYSLFDSSIFIFHLIHVYGSVCIFLSLYR